MSSQTKQSLHSFRIVFISGQNEYESDRTLPMVAEDAERYGAQTTVLTAYPNPANPSSIPGLEALNHADLAVFYIRSLTLPEDQFKYIRQYIEKGKPVVGLCTTTHAFRDPAGHPFEPWSTVFGFKVPGAPESRHIGQFSTTDVFVNPAAIHHPVAQGVPAAFHVRSCLCRVLPEPQAGATVLLYGKSVNQEKFSVAIHSVAWTLINSWGGRTFTTTIGNLGDFRVPAVRKLLINGIHWALGADPQMTGFSKKHPDSVPVVRPGLTDPEPLNPFILSTTHKQWVPPGTLQKEWMPLTPVEKMAQTEYDALIVGSGAGGSAVLWRLCEQWAKSGKKIGMIESGPLLLPTHGRNLPTMDQERFVQFFENPLHTEYIGRHWPEYPGAKIIRALGGRTLQWNLVSPRLTAVQFESWPISYREIISYYLIAEEMMGVTTDYAKGSSIQRTLLKRLRARGLADAQALPIAADLQASQFGIIHSDVFTSSINFLANALNIKPFDLAVNIRANQVLTDNGKAAGVKVMTPDNKSYTIAAKTVIISAGTWETPRLLLHSGIPGKAIGHYLVNHPKLITTATGSRDQFGEVSGVASLMIPNPDNRRILITGIASDPEQYYWYAYKDKPYLNELKFRFFCQGTMEPRFENHVFLVPGAEDEYGVPRLQVKFSYSNQDRVMIAEQFKFLEKTVELMGLEYEMALRLLIPGEDNHECGTCRMGMDPDTSATDIFGQIHAISGLFVADNSVVRLSGPANPTLTTVALAIRTADYISGQIKS